MIFLGTGPLCWRKKANPLFKAMTLLLTNPEAVQPSRLLRQPQLVLPPADRQLHFLSRTGDRIGAQATTGLGLIGFASAWATAHFFTISILPALFCLYIALTALPMVVASVGFNRTHQRASSGLNRNPESIDWQRSGIKVLGFFATLFLLLGADELLPRTARDFYAPAVQFLFWLAPTLVVGVPTYFVWIDRRMVEPQDGYWHMGLFALGRWRMVSWRKLKNHALDWIIKGYFLPFMFAGALVHLQMLSQKGLDFSAFGYFYGSMLNLIFSIDICFGALGYLLTLRILDAHIRSPEPTLLGWLSALICYAPLAPLLWGRFLHYEGRLIGRTG